MDAGVNAPLDHEDARSRTHVDTLDQRQTSANIWISGPGCSPSQVRTRQIISTAYPTVELKLNKSRCELNLTNLRCFRTETLNARDRDVYKQCGHHWRQHLPEDFHTPPPTPVKHCTTQAKLLPCFPAKLAGRPRSVCCHSGELQLPTGCAVMWETQFVEGGRDTRSTEIHHF